MHRLLWQELIVIAYVRHIHFCFSACGIGAVYGEQVAQLAQLGLSHVSGAIELQSVQSRKQRLYVYGVLF